MLALALMSSIAWTAPDAIRWDAPPGCPSADDVRARVSAYLGTDAPPLATVDARVERRGDRYAMMLEVRASVGSARHELEDPSCEVLARAAALIAALHEDKARVLEAVVARPSVVAAPPIRRSPAVETPLRSPGSAPDRPARATGPTRPGGSLRASAWAGTGLLPRIDLGVELAGGVVLPRLRLELGARHGFRQPARRADDELGVDVSAYSGLARACPRLRLRRIELLLCAGVEVGAAIGRGVGVPLTRRAAAPWVSVVLAPALTWALHQRVSLFAGLEAFANLLQPRFHVAGAGEVWRTPAGGARLVLGLEVRLGPRGQRS